MRIVRRVFVIMVVFAAVAALLARGSKAQTPRDMAALDAPGSVWRGVSMSSVQTGELEHCSLVNLVKGRMRRYRSERIAYWTVARICANSVGCITVEAKGGRESISEDSPGRWPQVGLPALGREPR